MTKSDVKVAFFGGEPLAVPVLEELRKAALLPQLIVCNPDRPAGRSHILTPPSVKVWAEENATRVFQPESLSNGETLKYLQSEGCDLFVVVAYGRIIPKAVLDMPRCGVLNMHPSLLPKYRGPSPIRSAILHDDKETGVTVIKLDEELDHGPILAQEKLEIAEEEWPLRGQELDARLARVGGHLLADTIPKWLGGEIKPREQDHEQATFTKKITKADGELDLDDDPYTNYLKFCAYDGWPGTFFFAEVNGKKMRVKITDAALTESGMFEIQRVTPEGRQEMDYEDFLHSLSPGLSSPRT